MATQYRITYFNSRGYAELSRMLLKLAGKEFTDRRVERGAEWDALKSTMPKGELPVLEVDGKMICESFAMARYLAREFNLYGANNWEMATCDMVLDTVVGVYQALIVLIYRAKTEEEKVEAKRKVVSAVEATNKLVASLKKGKYLLGDNPSIADASIHNLTEVCQAVPDFDFAPYDTVNAIGKGFSEIPAIAEWIKTRPETKM